MITLTFGGSMRVMPNYNVMGVAKAALEASVRYLAFDFGRRHSHQRDFGRPGPHPRGAGHRRCAAMFAFQQKHSPLGRGVTLDELGGSALYLLSDLSGGVTGEIHYVDSGYNVISMPRPEDMKPRRVGFFVSPRCTRQNKVYTREGGYPVRRGFSAQSLLSLEYWIVRSSRR